MIKNVDYIVVNELPEIQQELFNKWMVGQTRPLVESEGDNKFNCAFKWDYDRWFAYYRKNLVAPIND